MSNFGEFSTALAARDEIREIAKKVIDEERPKYKYGKVTSISPDQKSATVRLNGEENSVPVQMGAVRPTEVDQLVRVNGLNGDKYIDDVYGSAEIPEQVNVDADTVSGHTIGDGVAPPTGLLLTTDSHFEEVWIDASWTAPNTDDISGYDVELAENISGSFVLDNVFRVGGTYKRMTGLKPVTQYGVRVATINRIGVRSIYLPSSGWQVVITTKDDTIPDQVTGLTVGAGFRSITLRWNETDDPDVILGHGQYEVHLDTSSAFGGSKVIQYTTGSIIAFNDLTPGTQYFLRVRAIDSSGNFGAWSDTISATTAFVGTVDLTDAAITTDKLASGSVSTSKLANLAVDASKLANSSVESTKIANLAVGSAAIQALAVGTAHIADASILTAKIGDLAVTTAKINDLAVSNAKIANLAVDNAKIANLDAAKINAGTINADRIAANSLVAEKLQSSTLSTVQLTIASSGSLRVGNPPTEGLLINSQGLRLYQGSVAKVILDSTGSATFEGTINASNMNGGTITGATIRTAVSGQRVAFEAGIISKLKMYTGDAQEVTSGELNVGSGGPVLEVGLYSPKVGSNNFGGVQAGATNTVGGVGYVQLQVFKPDNTTTALFKLDASVTAGRNATLAFIDQFTIQPKATSFKFEEYNAVTGVLSMWSPGGSAAGIGVYNGDGNQVVCLNAGGNGYVAIKASAFNVSSARNTKRYIVDAPSAISTIKNLKVVKFQRMHPTGTKLDKNSEAIRWGAVAEDLATAFPDSAILSNDDGMPNAYDLGSVVWLGIKAIQDIIAQLRI